MSFIGHDGPYNCDCLNLQAEPLDVQAQHYDGNIAIPGCDKNMPGCLMAAARHNRPTIIVYGGTIQAGVRHLDCPAMGYKKGDPVNISDAFESFGMRIIKYDIDYIHLIVLCTRCIHCRKNLRRRAV